MIALPNETVDRLLALVSALRRMVEDAPPAEARALLTKLEYLGSCPLSVGALSEMEDVLAGCDELPLLGDDEAGE